MIKNDLISVVMCNYNAPEEYLRNAIDSILEQTYENFEYIIIDDGSTDNSLEIIRSYHDKRIVLIEKTENTGLSKSLNIGMDIAKGEFIARMDSDDISEPSRFEKQVAFLKSNHDHVVCGTYARFIGNVFKKIKSGVYNFDLPSREIFQIRLMFANFPSIVHPSAMFNHKLLIQNGIRYDERYRFAQDYKMWVDCCKVAECANYPEFLLQYRIHDASVSHEKKSVRDGFARMIIDEQLAELHLTLPENWKQIHWGCLNRQLTEETALWIKTIIEQNKKYKKFDQDLLERAIYTSKAYQYSK